MARDGRNAVGGALLPLVPRYLRGRRQTTTTLTAEAAKIPAGSDGLIWAPYLLGERTPHLDSQATAAFVGITAGHTRAHFVRAVLEGVAYSLRDTFTLFAELGIPGKGRTAGRRRRARSPLAQDSGQRLQPRV